MAAITSSLEEKDMDVLGVLHPESLSSESDILMQ
jgi:hypothetical protein